MSEGRIVVNESSAEIGDTFWELVTKQEGTQTRAIFGGTVIIEVIVLLVSEMENKYSRTLLRLKGEIPVDSIALILTPK